MNEKNTDFNNLKRLKIPVSISIINENNERSHKLINPDSMLLIIMEHGMKINNKIGKK